MGAELGIGGVVVAVQHVGEIGKQGFLVMAIKRLQAETLAIEKTNRDADNLPELGIDAGALIDVGRGEVGIVAVELFGLLVP